MKFCTNCGKEVSENHAFCEHCGTATSNTTPVTPPAETVSSASKEGKSSERISDFLRLLCIFTILGSIFGIFRGLIYEMVTTVGNLNQNYIRGFLYVFTNFGTLVGAILMLLRQKRGLYIYTGSQVVYIVVVIFASFVYESADYFEGAETFAWSLALFFLLPSILFLLLYWMKVNVDQLTN